MNNMPEDFREEFQLKIDFLVSKIQELETVHTLRLDQLLARVEDLEQFQRNYESEQEYQRDRSE